MPRASGDLVLHATPVSSYDLVVVGSGFASSFFLREYLANASSSARVQVLERGYRRPHAWQLEHLGELHREARSTFVNRHPRKPWVFDIALGGSSNCWWGCTPRMLPADFELLSRYGIGVDWPIRYDELEPYYSRVERWMQVSGSSDRTPFERSEPYPQPPHRWSTPDQALAAAFEQFYVQPTARARRATERRPACCTNATCTTCPIDAKFRIPRDMDDLWKDPRVELRLGVPARRLLLGAEGVEAVDFGGPAPGRVQGTQFVLGANGLFNAHLLLRSGHPSPEVGRGLLEQSSVTVTVDLDRMIGFDGSTSVTGHGYMLYDGPHRRERAAALIETMNVPRLRTEPGRWRDRVVLKLIYEDLRQPANRVTLDEASPARPIVEWTGHSDYTERSIAAIHTDLERVLEPLPVQRYSLSRNATESHVMGTVPMGADPMTSVVDADLVDHRYRNLRVVGASAFPTAPPANPTLTLCALSVRSAAHLAAAT